MIIVKRFVAGLIVGMLLMTGIATASQIIGQHMDYKIVINGQQRQLDKLPVVIDGSTYLPVRALAQLLGYTVDFDANSGNINLTNQVISQPVPVKSSIINRIFVKLNGKTYEYSGSILLSKIIDKDAFVTVGVFATLLGIDNDDLTIDERDLPGGIAGYISLDTRKYMTSKRQYYDMTDVNSKYYIDYTFTNPRSQKSWSVRLDESELGNSLPNKLDDLITMLGIDATYTTDLDNKTLTIEFK
jgi:hypothetical protein